MQGIRKENPMISSSYLMLIVATLVIGMGAQWYVNH